MTNANNKRLKTPKGKKYAKDCNNNQRKNKSKADLTKMKNKITLKMRNKAKLLEANGEHENRKAWRQGKKETQTRIKKH